MNCFGKNVIITGGTGGIGMAVVREMLKHGAKAIGILDIADSQLIQTLQSDFPQQTIAFLKTDVRKRKQLNLAFEEFISNFDYVDIVVSGAGIINEGDPDDTVLINLLGVINTTYEAIDHMSVNGSGRGGIIANISSLAGIGYFHASPVYCGTKFGVVGFSKSVAVEAKKHGVNITVICPGATDTAICYKKSKLIQFTKPKRMTEEFAKCFVEILANDKEAAIWTVKRGKIDEFIPDVYNFCD